MLHLQPFNDKVLVKQHTATTVLKSGILIPENAMQASDQGTVVAIGPGKKNKSGIRIPLSVNVNDHILFVKGSGIKVRYNTEDYLILDEKDIFGVII
jgi:chaperonin GroES